MGLSCEDILAVLKEVPGFSRVRFVVLYGSVAEGRAGTGSDIDICVYYEGDEEEASRFRVDAMTARSPIPRPISGYSSSCRSMSGSGC